MVSKFKLILETIPLFELEDFYTYMYNKCNYDRESLEYHILNMFKQYLQIHRVSEKCEVKCFVMLSWFSTMYEQYVKK